ncbi:MAG: DNA polymerase III subunit delta [Pyrinomonadaceae bacterium]
MYVLFGQETYLRDIATRFITDRAFAPGDFRDFNETVFSLDGEDNLQRALAAAEQLPMMATKRVIRVDNVRVSATGFRDTINEDHEATLSAYLANPSPSSVVIFVADELNGVRKMGKFLREKTTAVEFTRLDDKQLAEWARKAVGEAGAEIDEVTLRLFLSRVGADVRRLSNEINKLAAAALPEKRITAELIDALVPNSRELSNFDLTDHLVAGRKGKALTALKKILDDGAEPLALLGLISYNFRRLLIAKDMMDRAAPRQEIASAAKLFGRGQDEFLASARRVDKEKLVNAIQLIAKTDLAIKTSIGGSGNAGSRLQIEMLVCELAV